MKYQAKLYQQKAIDKIIDKEAVGLFLDMGLGKTAVALTAMNQLINYEESIKKALVIAPLRVARSTWTDEQKKWDHLKDLKLVKVLGTAGQRQKALTQDGDVFLINRENIPWLIKYLGKGWFFDMLVIDELTSFKNRTTKRWKALRKIRSNLKKVIGLTGSPIANGLLDLWAQVWLLDQGEALGKSFSVYRDMYFDPDQRNREIIYSWKPKRGSLEVIQDKVSDLCISMKKEDWLDLPDVIYNRVNVEWDDTSWSIYDQFERERLVPYLKGGDIEAGSAAAVTTKLLQMTGGACYDDQGGFQIINSHKLDALEEIAEVMYGNPILVYYQYQHELARLQNRFPNAVKLKDENDIRRWNESEIPMLLAHPASAGHGLNLQHGGSTIVWFTLTYSLEYYQQANARIHRQGQTSKVMIHHLTVKDSIDDAVIDALSVKDQTQEALLTALKYRVKKIQEKNRSLDLQIQDAKK